jgi:hypothetical protein
MFRPMSKPVGVVADGHPPSVSVLLTGLASEHGTGREFRERQCSQPPARDGLAWPLAGLLRFGRVDAVKADALPGYLDGVAIDDAGGTGNVPREGGERQ